jgi:hypothetical protein
VRRGKAYQRWDPDFYERYAVARQTLEDQAPHMRVWVGSELGNGYWAEAEVQAWSR